MSEFTNDFAEVYRADLLAMLESGEELSLFHRPAVSLSGSLDDGTLEGLVDGKPVKDFDPETPEGVWAITYAKEGAIDLNALKAMASIDLMSGVFFEEFGEAVRSGLTPEQETVAQAIYSKVDQFMENPVVNYSKHVFDNTNTGEQVIAESARLSDNSGSQLGRSLELSIHDNYLIKTLTIYELPISFKGDTTLQVKQSLVPKSDGFFSETAHFFAESDFDEGNSLIMRIFANEITGSSSNEEEELLSRFTDPNDLEKIREILDKLKTRAAATKENSKLLQSNPEIELPSADELQEYKDLLAQMRP